MVQIKKQFYRNGVDRQKVADVTFDLKRPGIAAFTHWSVEQKILLKAFINDAELSFKLFISELKKLSR